MTGVDGEKQEFDIFGSDGKKVAHITEFVHLLTVVKNFGSSLFMDGNAWIQGGRSSDLSSVLVLTLSWGTLRKSGIGSGVFRAFSG